jgi:radical SAM superfamily enzyme YgiQ (UPF0313 family)
MAANGRPKTVLVYPPTGSISTYNTPTGLLYIGSYLKKHGYPVKLVDCWAEPKYRDVLEREVKDTDFLGIYAMSVHIRYILPELERLKKINPRMKIIWGGPHALLFPQQTARSNFADIVARCEGEELMLEILRGHESGKLDLRGINGICFKEDGEVISTPDRGFVDVNSLPFLDWSLVKKEVMDEIRRTIIRVQASRGCPYQCSFCINVLTKNLKMRYRDPRNVLDEIEHIYNEYNIRRVGFRDEIFLSNRRQTKAIAQGLLERNLRVTWLANPRVEYLRESYIDDDFLQLLVDSGCNKLQGGGESGSQRILDLLRKDITVDDILNFARRTKKFNIIPVIAFMTGIPTETREEQLETLRLIREIRRIQPRAFINGPANFRPYPGGELWDMCVKQYGLKMPDSLEEWARAEILGGARLPWVKKMHFNQFIWTEVRADIYPKKLLWKNIKQNPIKGLAILCFVLLSKFRLKCLFYRFPIEFRLLDWYYKYILKKVPDFA